MADPDAFRRTPKIELHLHVAGSVRPTTIGEWVAADGLPASLTEEYRPAQAREGLPRFLARFGAWDATVRTPERMSQAVQELCDDLASDCVAYAELRLRPPADDDSHWHALMEAAVDATRPATAPTTRFIVVVLRGWDPTRAEREARRAVAWAGRGVVGFDVAGDESIDAEPFVGAIQLAREAGLGISVHAGETGGAASVRRALDLFAPDRIAHGVGAAEDPRLVRELRDRNVHLEMALRSNVQTGAVPDPRVHPFGRLLRAGLSVGLNTDNRTICGTALSDEYDLAARSLGLSWGELARSTMHAAEACFLPADARRDLCESIQHGWAAAEPRSP